MLWLSKHARTRKQLSPYIDGQLSTREEKALEDHLGRCEACRRRRDELRATISAAGGLVDVEPPRSFVLSPRMLEQRRAVAPAPLSPLTTRMRLATAGVALTLAVLVVGDLGGVGGGMNDGVDEGGGARQGTELQMSDADTNRGSDAAPAPAASGAAEESAADGANRSSPANPEAQAGGAEACPLSNGPSQGGAGAGAGGVGGAGGPVTATDEPTPTAEPAPTPSANPDVATSGDLAACAPAVAGAPSATEAPDLAAKHDRGEFEAAPSPETSSDDGGGMSGLTVVEIILGGVLAALIGAIAIEYTLRRWRAA